jgi:hypothetical protein
MEIESIALSCSIQAIAHNRDAQPSGISRMNSKLVSASSKRGELDSGFSAFAGEHLKDRGAGFAGLDINPLSGAIAHHGTQGEFNHPMILTENSIQHRDVNFLDGALLKLLAQFGMGIGIFCQEQDAGGVLVEPMNRHWSL